MPNEKTRNDYDDGNIPEIDLPQREESKNLLDSSEKRDAENKTKDNTQR